MEKEYFVFDPGTNTGQAPMATTFEHLLGFAAKLEQYLTIHNQEDIVNINKLLETTLNLQISNIIQRVIAQVIGEHGEGFVTIKGTEDGALHVYVAGSDETEPVHVTIEAGSELIGTVRLDDTVAELVTLNVGTNLIGKVEIEGSSHEVKNAVISKKEIGNTEIIPAVGAKKLCLVNLAFTVAAEAIIYLNSNTTHGSGPMNFGAAGEPKGIVINNGNFPLKTVAGDGFFIESNTDAQISGFVTYYEE